MLEKKGWVGNQELRSRFYRWLNLGQCGSDIHGKRGGSGLDSVKVINLEEALALEPPKSPIRIAVGDYSLMVLQNGSIEFRDCNGMSTHIPREKVNEIWDACCGQSPVYWIALDKDQIRTLRTILELVGGCPEKSDRKYADQILESIKTTNVPGFDPPENPKTPSGDYGGSITLLNTD